jgi:hypothetical protein
VNNKSYEELAAELKQLIELAHRPHLSTEVRAIIILQIKTVQDYIDKWSLR